MDVKKPLPCRATSEIKVTFTMVQRSSSSLPFDSPLLSHKTKLEVLFLRAFEQS